MQTLKEISEKIGLLVLDLISYIEQEDGIKKFKKKFLQLTDSIPDEQKNKSLDQLQDKIVDFLEKLESESYKSQDEYEELTEQVSESLEEFETQLDTGVSGEQTGGSTSENESVPEDADAEEEQKMTLDDSDFAADLELINDFIEESREDLENAELNLVELEKEPTDKEKINTVFRTFHTMKGVAGFLGFGKIVEIAHNTEDLLDEIRNDNISLDNDIFDVLFQMVDVHKDSIAELSLDEAERSLDTKAVEGYKKILSELRQKKEGGEEIFKEETKDEVELGDKKTPIKEKPKEDKKKNKEKKGEKISKKPKNIPPPPKKDKKKTPKLKKKKKKSSAKTTSDHSIKVSSDKLDFLIDMIGELVISANMIKGDEKIKKMTDVHFEKKLAQLTEIVRSLQDSSLALRMVPIGDTFVKMHRIVRDITRKNNKKIQLNLVGEDTEIDRNVVDSIYDPLVHMLRNSCDHGIELPAERKNSGKPKTGIVTLNAYHKGNKIHIEINDDGKGLDKDAIIEKAIAKGLIESAKNMSDQAIYKLILLPGFSTAKTISNISGRGVGMDVVAKFVENIGGTIEIRSEIGKGSTVIMKVPLTLAIIQGLIANVGEQQFIIPIMNIKRSTAPKSESINKIAGGGETFRDNNKIVPIVRLHEKFEIENAITDTAKGTLIIIETAERDFALLVDEVVDIHETVVKPLTGQFKDIDGIAGGTIMSNGTVGLIMDINRIEIE